jgi:hypothetical protein
MVQLGVPHINVISKMDLLEGDKSAEEVEEEEEHGEDYESFFNVDTDVVVQGRFSALDQALAQLIKEYDMVSFIPLNITQESSIEYLLASVDNAVQYGEDLEPKEPKEFGVDEPEVESVFE